MRQILNYVSILCEAKDDENKIAFDKPILLTIVTVHKEPKNKNTVSTNGDDTVTDIQGTNLKMLATQDVCEADSTKNSTDTEIGEKLEVRYGVFLCTRKENGGNGDKYRIALLWRKDTSYVNDASI